MSRKILNNCIQLKGGNKMPLLGLGCWQSVGKDVENAVETALDSGYRHVDTAYAYLNEDQVGNGIHSWIKTGKGKREDIFLVTKLPSIGMAKGGPEKFLKMSLKKLNLSYADLYLVHGPIGMKGKTDIDVFPMENGRFIVDDGTDLIAIWKEMEKLVESGLAKSIGVSNFSIKQMKKINAIAKIPISVNQVEMHVSYQQKELVDFCTENDIVVTAYAPLGSPGRATFVESSKTGGEGQNILANPVVQLIADKHNVTSAQVLIRFLVQMGVVAIPKSVTPGRIKANGDVFSFSLDKVDNAALLLLDKGKQGGTFNMINAPGIKDHPENPV